MKNGTQEYYIAVKRLKHLLLTTTRRAREARSKSGYPVWPHFCEVQNQVKFAYSDRSQGSGCLEEGENQLEGVRNLQGCECPRFQPKSCPLIKSHSCHWQLDQGYVKP